MDSVTLGPIPDSQFYCTDAIAKMPPHGAGMSGATHSHNPEYPDDNWNLYSMIESTTVAALNVTRPTDAIGVFKPFVHRLSNEPELISDSDEEIIVRHR